MRKNFVSFITGLALIFLLAACAPLGAPGVGLNLGLANSKLDNSPAQNQPVPAQQTGTVAQSPMRTLSVTGVGTVYLTPDIATITVGVHSENKDITQAVTANNASIQKVKDALVKSGIDEKDIQTQNFNVYQNQKYDANGQPTETVYAVDNNLSVIVRDISQVGKLLGTVVSSGANSINGITFDVADKTQAMTDAHKLALSNAQNQAEEIATELGATLGSVQSAVVNYSESSVTVPYGVGGGPVARPAAINVPISTGQLVVTTTIQLIYEIK
ncbi:MAG: SIMPL domain-containing protein [Anaerolineaceae bacterium]|jgi:uncharacterized protein YggE